MASGAILLHWLQNSYIFAVTNEEVWENISWPLHHNLNISKYDDLSSVTPYITRGRLDTLQPLTDIALDLLTEYIDLPIKTSASKLGLITGLVLSLVLNSKFYIFKLLEESKFLHWLQTMVLRSLFSAACLILAIILAPFIGVFLIVLMCYRQGVHLYLKSTQPKYVQLFEGLDAIWAVEEETSRSIINVLAFFEVKDLDEGRNLLSTFRKTIVNHLATPPLPCEKLFYLRQQFLGYFYWERQTEFNIEDYIRPMTTIPPDYESTRYNNEFPHRISEETLKNIVADLSNTMLPKDHTACWEILVGSQPVKKSAIVPSLDTIESRELNFPNVCSESSQYPIMFRIHHSIGDGIALMQLLVSVMTDVPCLSASPDTEYKHSPRLPPISMPARKFQPSNTSEGNNTLQMESGCKTGRNLMYRKHQAQSPAGLNTNQFEMMSDNRYHSERHSKESGISTDLQNTEENNTVVFRNSKNDEPQINLRCIPLCSQIKTSPVTMNCRQRPLLLNNCSESSRPEQFYCKSKRNKQGNSSQIPCPISQPIPKLETVLGCYSKISGSCNEPLSTITTSKLSPINSNFQTSLPILNLCQTQKHKSIFQQHSQNNMKSYSKNYESENDLINSPQNIRCQYPTQTRMSLEEPPSLFNKSKSTSSLPIPKTTYRLPTSSKIHGSKNMKLHCCNHTKSESYITIPEDIVCSTIETSANTSTTVYYYSPTTSPENPTPSNNPDTEHTTEILTNVACMETPKSILSNRSTSPLSNEQISLVNCENSSPESNFEEINVVTSAQTMPRSSSPIASSSMSLKLTSIKTDKYTVQNNNNYFGWDTIANEATIQNRKTKSEGDLKRMQKICNTELQAQLNVTMNPSHGKHHIKKINTVSDNTESSNIQNTDNETNQCDVSMYLKKETGITLNGKEDDYSQNCFRRLKCDWNKLWDHFKVSECKVTNNTESAPTQQSDDQNRYGQLLNTNNINTSCPKKPEKFTQFIETICTLVLTPVSLINQALMKATDRNVLHGPPLTGYKVIAWHRDLNGQLLNRIKKLKSYFNTRFTEVFLTALSASLETYFATHQVSYNDGIPNIVNVVIPARMEQLKYNTTTKKINLIPSVTRKVKGQQQGHSLSYAIPEEETIKLSTNRAIEKDSSEDTWNISRDVQEREMKVKEKVCNMTTFDLSNRFSVAMLQLPVSQAALPNYQGNEYIKVSPRRRLDAVCHNFEMLRKSPDYQVNYWLLKIVASYLTKTMLTALIRSSQSTLVVSNIMGPTQELTFGGSKLQDIIFWVPHRGTTGIGITVMSCMGHLEIGIMADRAVIHCKEDAQMILDEIVLEISKLDVASSQTARGTQRVVKG